MLRTRLLHPEILGVLAALGHGSQVLITDGNFPHLTAPNPVARRVFLNVTPGVLSIQHILPVIAETVVIEAVALMVPDAGEVPPVHEEILALLPPSVPVSRLTRFDFYEATESRNVGLVVATADTRPYANVLLTMGGVSPA
jgi:L-fucose mutarotase